MRKAGVVISILLVLAGIGGTSYFGYKYYKTIKERDVLVQQNGELQSAIDAIGPVSDVWTVKADVFPGKEIKADDLVKQTIPVSSINENYILNQEDLVGKYYKVGLKPGTSLTKDVVMEEEMPETVYERDMTFGFIPLGLKEGDYVDIRAVLPKGEEFIVVEHKRIEDVVTDTNTVKVILTESELARWTSSLKDKALYGNKGLGLYITKYVEPGLHDSTIPFYPVRKEMESVVTLNPNITNKKECINAGIRDEIEKMLANVTDDIAGNLASGVQEEANGITSSSDQYFENLQNKQLGETDSSTGNKNPSNVVNAGDPTIQSEYDKLEEIGESVNLDPVDAQGNTSNVTETQQDNAAGEDLFTDEEVIQ